MAKIQKANEKYEEYIKLGWEETPDGLLPPDEIKRAGFIKQGGQWLIPTDVYIAEVASAGLKKGAKYIGISMQYIHWKEKFFNKIEETGDAKIEKEIREVKQYDMALPRISKTDVATKVAKSFGGVKEINVADIPF